MVPEFVSRPSSDGLPWFAPPSTPALDCTRLSGLHWLASSSLAVFDSIMLPALMKRLDSLSSHLSRTCFAWSVIVMTICLLAVSLVVQARGICLQCEFLVVRTGVFGQRTTVLLRKKIQWAASRQNPLQRWNKLASISAVTAAGTSGTTTRLRDLNEEEADAYLDWIRPRQRN